MVGFHSAVPDRSYPGTASWFGPSARKCDPWAQLWRRPIWREDCRSSFWSRTQFLSSSDWNKSRRAWRSSSSGHKSVSSSADGRKASDWYLNSFLTRKSFFSPDLGEDLEPCAKELVLITHRQIEASRRVLFHALEFVEGFLVVHTLESNQAWGFEISKLVVLHHLVGLVFQGCLNAPKVLFTF